MNENDTSKMENTNLAKQAAASDSTLCSDPANHKLLDLINEGIAIIDLNQTIVYANPAAGIIFNVTEEHLLNQPLDIFLQKGQAEVLEIQKNQYQKGIRAKFEIEIKTPDGTVKVVRVSGTPLFDSEGKRTGSLNLFVDITHFNNDKKEIKQRLDLKILVHKISNDFIHLKRKDLDFKLNDTLKQIGIYANVDRSYIFQFSDDGKYCDNTYEWCKEGIEPQIENLQNIPVDVLPWWTEKMQRLEIIHLPLLSALPPEAQYEKEILEAQEIKSLLVIPIHSSGVVFGFVGFDSVLEVKNWKDNEIQLLLMVGEIIGEGLDRIKQEIVLLQINRQLEEKVEERTQDLSQLMKMNQNIIESLNLILVSTDKNGIIRSINPFAEKILGYKAKELVGKHTPLVFLEPEYFYKKIGIKMQQPELSIESSLKRFSEISSKFESNKSCEWIFESIDHRKISVLLSLSKIEDKSGETTGFVAAGIDITERKQIESYSIMLRDLGFSLATMTTIEQALSLINRTTLKIEDVVGVCTYLINNESEELDLVFRDGVSDCSRWFPEMITKANPLYKVILSGEPTYKMFSDFVPDPSLLENKTYPEQIGMIPIKSDGKIIGSINVALRSLDLLHYSTKLLLETISSQIGGTLARIRMEDELKDSQKNFELMFNAIKDYMFILSDEGKIIKTNPIVERSLGYTKEELCGMSILELHPPAQREEALNIVMQMIQGKLTLCPIPLYKRDGHIIPVETKVVAGIWNGHKALYGISRDISQRLIAEEKLRESEQRLHLALEGSGDGVWDWNVLTNQVLFSDKWKKMLGYESEEISNNLDEWQFRVHPDDLQKCTADIERHLRGETEVYENEQRILCKDGHYKWILDRGKIVDWTADGKPSRFIGTHSDITKRKILEEQLQKTLDKEKELNELKSHFVSTASHEFRTPLASMMMISETLITHQDKMDQLQISDRLTKIKNHVLHLSNIVNDVLQLSKIQEGKIGFALKEKDLISLCSNIIDGFNSSVLPGKRQIEFVTDMTKMLVMIDEGLMTQALNNLLSNAIKYSGDDPDIQVNLALNDTEWMIHVRDHGIGIPESEQKQLFSPFFRATNVNKIKGNGIGLSILQESIRMLGGEVSFVSKVSEGSTFTLHFPVSLITQHSLE